MSSTLLPKMEPLESLPRDKNVMIGVVTSGVLELECKEELMHRTSLSGESTDSALQSLGVCSQTTGLYSIETERS